MTEVKAYYLDMLRLIVSVYPLFKSELVASLAPYCGSRLALSQQTSSWFKTHESMKGW